MKLLSVLALVLFVGSNSFAQAGNAPAPAAPQAGSMSAPADTSAPATKAPKHAGKHAKKKKAKKAE